MGNTVFKYYEDELFYKLNDALNIKLISTNEQPKYCKYLVPNK